MSADPTRHAAAGVTSGNLIKVDPPNPRNQVPTTEISQTQNQNSADVTTSSQSYGRGLARSPVYTLTADVLSEIILWSLPTERVTSIEFFEGRVAPNNIAGVCRFWRFVALSRGLHWATIRLAHFFPEVQQRSRHQPAKPIAAPEKSAREAIPLGIIKSSLRRSGNAPLTLDIGVEYARAQGFEELIQLIHDQRARCVDVRINFPTNRVAQVVLDASWRHRDGTAMPPDKGFLRLEDMSNIRRLHLRLPYWQNELDLARFPRRLESLYLDVCQRFTLKPCASTWLECLTSVILDPLPSDASISGSSCVALLNAANALQLFMVTVDAADEVGQLDYGHSLSPELPVHMPKLTHLGLFYDMKFRKECSGLNNVLRRISAPRLQQLSVGLLDGEPADANGWNIPFRHVLEHSSPLLDMQHLTINTISVVETCAGLRCVPELCTLELNIIDDWAEMIRSLTPQDDPDSEVLCPNLEHLQIKFLQDVVATELLVELILARWASPKVQRRLKKITLYCCRCSSDIRQDARIAHCLRDGLVIEVEKLEGSLVSLATYCGLPGITKWL